MNLRSPVHLVSTLTLAVVWWAVWRLLDSLVGLLGGAP